MSIDGRVSCTWIPGEPTPQVITATDRARAKAKRKAARRARKRSRR